MDKKVFPFATNIRSTATNTTESQPTWEEKYFKQLSQREDNTDDVNDSIMTSKNIVSEIPLDEIALSPFQTREISSSDDLEELKNSILSKGIIQPIIVRELGSSSQSDAKYELVAGERRLRATKQAGLNNIPAIVYDLNDQESLELSIIENAQRENLNPIEEAQAYKMLGDKFHLNQSEIAKVVGKNRVSIANSLRLLSLEIEIIELLKSGELTAGHGRDHGLPLAHLI